MAEVTQEVEEIPVAEVTQVEEVIAEVVAILVVAVILAVVVIQEAEGAMVADTRRLQRDAC